MIVIPGRASPESIVKAINDALADPGLKARLAGLGDEPRPGAAADFGEFITAETEKWAKVVKSLGLKQS